MREIKFRAWDNDDYMSSPFTLQDIQAGRIEWTEDVKIMQYTGLKDKKVKGRVMGNKKGFRNWVIQLVQDQPIAYTKRSTNIAKEFRNYLWKVDDDGKILNDPDPSCSDHHMNGIEYALSTLGKLKQQEHYLDRIYFDGLAEQTQEDNVNPAV